MTKKKKKTNKLAIILVILLLATIVGAFFFVKLTLSPVSSSKNEVEFVVEENTYGKQVFTNLEEKNVINNGTIAYYAARILKYDTEFMAGTYLIDTSKDLKDILSYISDAKNSIQDTVTVKFIEGSNLKEIAEEICSKTNLDYDGLINYWKSEDTLKELMGDYPFLTDELLNPDIKFILEGYLYPDTYEFFTHTDYEEVTRKILNETLKVYNEFKDQFDSSSYSINEIFSLASIIQRESSGIDVMKNVSSVFHNRLNIGMRLESSVTVCYVLGIGLGGEWQACELDQDNYDPYNTRQIYGLTPGPICSPGKDAIDAALNPNETNYYFFIGNVCGDGTSYFEETYAQQLEDIARYLTCY